MPLSSAKLGPARTWPVEARTRITPVPPGATVAGRAAGDELSAPVTRTTRQATTPRARAGGRSRSSRRRCPPWLTPTASPATTGATGRSSTMCGTLADLDPARDRGHAGGQDEQQVPARRGVVAVRGRAPRQPGRAVG